MHRWALCFLLIAAPTFAQNQPPAQSGERTQAAAHTESTAQSDATPAEPTPEKSIQDELYNKENELGQAQRDHNATFFEQNLAGDFLYVAFNGLVLTKDKIVDALQHLQITTYEIHNVKFRPLGANAMQLAYDLTVQGDISGVPIPRQMYATSIWIKAGDSWRLAYHQTTPARHH